MAREGCRYHRCSEAVFAYQSGWWGKVSTVQLDSCRTESAGHGGWKSPTGLLWLSYLLSSGWKLAPWKVMGDHHCSAQSCLSLPHPVLSLLWEGLDRFGEQNWEGCWATFGFLPSSLSLLSIKPASLLCLDTTSRKNHMLFAKPRFAENVWPRLWLVFLAHLPAKPALNQPSVSSQCLQTWVQCRAEGGRRWRSSWRLQWIETRCISTSMQLNIF